MLRLVFLTSLLALLLWAMPGSGQQASRDSLLALIRVLPEDTARVDAYYEYGRIMEDIDLDSAAWYYRQAGEASQRLGYVRGLLSFYSNYTFVLNLQGKLEESYRLNHQALRLARSHGLRIDEAKALSNIASSHNYAGTYDSAIIYYLQSANVFESEGITDYHGILYQNIGVAFDALGQHDKAVEYGLRCIEHSLNVGDSTGIASGLVNIGGSLSSMGRYDSAVVVLRRALDVSRRTGYAHGAQAALVNLGDIHVLRREYDDAREAFSESLTISRNLNFPGGGATSLSGLARVLFHQNRFKEAERYAMEALAISEREGKGVFTDLRQQYKLVARIKAKLNKAEEAYMYLEKYVVMNDSLSGHDINKITADLERKYQLARKDKELAENQLKLQKVESAVRMKNTQLVFLVVGLLLMGSLLFLLIRFFRAKHRLQEQEMLALQQQQEMIRLRANLEGQQEERRRIAREMHDDIGSGLTSLVFLANTLGRSPESETTAARVASLARQMVDQMNEIVWSLNSAQDTLEDLVVYMRRNIGEMLDTVGLEYSFNIPSKVPECRISGAERRNIYLVVKEAVHNSIKHADATHVTLTMDFSSGMRITIADNGKGLKTDYAVGNGFKNMRYRMEQIGGSWKLTSQRPVKICLSFPLAV